MRGTGGDSRGASEVLAAGLLAGIVLAAAILTVTYGGALLGDAQSTNDLRQGQLVLQDVSSDVESLTRTTDATRTEIDFSDTNPGEFHLVREGRLNVSIDDGACATSINLTSLRYEQGGSVVAYEGGGVWRSNDENASSMITRPSVTTSDGRIQISLVNLSGVPEQATNPVVYHPERSKATTATHQANLSALSCRPPNNVTLSVTSDFSEAWGQYLQSEFGVDAAVYDTNDTARITLEQSDLPDRLNLSSNHVVNLSNPGYMDTVSISGGTPGEITFDKGEGNTYEASVELLHDGTPPWGELAELYGQNVTRPPVDVVFAIESTETMINNDDGDGISRLTEAKNASKGLVGELNGTRDRAGVVSYGPFESDVRYELTDEKYVTADFSSSGVNQTIDNMHTGGSDAKPKWGVRNANNVFDLKSNASRKKVMVLISGQNTSGCPRGGPARNCDHNSETLDLAEDAAQNGVTIYTVGIGPDVQDSLLQAVANKTGGRYLKYGNGDISDREDALDEIAREITKERVLFRPAVTANVTVGGTVHSPHVAGKDGHVIELTDPGGNEFKNMNDPTAPGEYAFGFDVDGGEAVLTRGYSQCPPTTTRHYNRTEFSVQHSGVNYTVLRCTTGAWTSLSNNPVQIMTDGDTLPADIHTNYNYTKNWREEINATFARRGDVDIDNSTGELDLQSNQALLYYRPPPGAAPEDWMLLIYEVGVRESDANNEIVDVTVSHVEFE